MNAVFSSRSTGDGGISPVSAPGICVTANCSAIAWHPPLWMEGRCFAGALADGAADPHLARGGGEHRANGARSICHVQGCVNAAPRPSGRCAKALGEPCFAVRDEFVRMLTTAIARA